MPLKLNDILNQSYNYLYESAGYNKYIIIKIIKNINKLINIDKQNKL